MTIFDGKPKVVQNIDPFNAPSVQVLDTRIDEIGRDVTAPAAYYVDRDARFPEETFAALRSAGALSAAVPKELGGTGCTIEQLARHCRTIGSHCGSSGLILSMHHIMVASLVRHSNDNPFVSQYLRRCAAEQRLIASSTSEVGPRGNMRRSECALEIAGPIFTLEKHATTISYGDYANDLLVTARNNPDAAPNDQAMVLALEGDYSISDKGSWDTIGMRGTRSEGGRINVRAPTEQIISKDFRKVTTLTKVPYSHILWSSCWLGIATGAVNKARAVLRKQARKQVGTIPQVAYNVVDLDTRLQSMKSDIDAVLHEFMRLDESNDEAALDNVAFTLRLNNLKINSSEAVVDIVTGALRAIGILAYMNNSEVSLSRYLRDAHSAALMISNDRIRTTNATLMLVHKGD